MPEFNMPMGATSNDPYFTDESDAPRYTEKELSEHIEMARMEGYDKARNDAFLAVKARADAWRKQDAEAANQLTTGFIKTRIAEDFECGEAILRIGYCERPGCRRGEPCAS